MDNHTTQYLTWFNKIAYIHGQRRSRTSLKMGNKEITKRTTASTQNPKAKPQEKTKNSQHKYVLASLNQALDFCRTQKDTKHFFYRNPRNPTS